MPKWLNAALDYIPRWLEFQLRFHGQPGCALAVAHHGTVALEAAFGSAGRGKRLTSDWPSGRESKIQEPSGPNSVPPFPLRSFA